MQPKSSSLLVTSAISGGIKVAGAALSYLMFLVVSKSVSVEHFGVFGVAFSLSVILSFTILLGQNLAAMRFWPGIDSSLGRDAANRSLTIMSVIVLSAAFVALCGGLIATLAGIALEVFGNDPRMFVFIAIFASTLAIAEFVSAALRARERIVGALVPRDLLWRGLVIVLVFFTAPISAQTAIIVAALLLLIVVLFQAMPTIRAVQRSYRHHGDHRNEARREVLAATPGLGLSSILSPVSEHVATVVVAIYVGPVPAAGYFAADRLSRLLSIPLFGINQVVSPRIARAWRKNDVDGSVRLLVESCVLAGVTAAAGLGVYYLFGDLALSLFGQTYKEAFDFLIVLSGGLVINSLFGSNLAFAAMTGMERWLSVAQIASIVAHAFFLVVLGGRHGALGVAYGQALGVLAKNIAISIVVLHGVKQKKKQMQPSSGEQNLRTT